MANSSHPSVQCNLSHPPHCNGQVSSLLLAEVFFLLSLRVVNGVTHMVTEWTLMVASLTFKPLRSLYHPGLVVELAKEFCIQTHSTHLQEHWKM